MDERRFVGVEARDMRDACRGTVHCEWGDGNDHSKCRVCPGGGLIWLEGLPDVLNNLVAELRWAEGEIRRLDRLSGALTEGALALSTLLDDARRKPNPPAPSVVEEGVWHE